MNVRMKRAYDYELSDGRRRRAPRGWVGDLPDDVAQAAISAGRAVMNGGASAPAGKVAEDQNKALDDMTKAELIEEAGRRGVDVAANSNKADIIAAIEASEK